MYPLIFGWIATTITIVYKLPQMYTFYKEKSSKGISILSFGIQTISYILYAIHGYIIKDPPIFIVSIASLVLNLILCCQYFYYKEKSETVTL
jgi:uncharacterized protein with PQ loop repeat